VEGEEDLAEHPPRDLAAMEKVELHGELVVQCMPRHSMPCMELTTQHRLRTTPCCSSCCVSWQPFPASSLFSLPLSTSSSSTSAC
jgi:hypothetical protein